MKFLAVFTIHVLFSSAEHIQHNGIFPILPASSYTAFGYLKNVGIPAAKKRLEVEEEFLNDQTRIVGGVPAANGQYPWQVGLISDIIGLEGRGICGGSLVSASRVVTAAHCWSDGVHQSWRLTVVLGSTLLFSGGTRVETSAVVTHTKWIPFLIRNDVAVVYLPSSVALSSLIAPIALPSEAQIDDSFVGQAAVASGFGITSDGAGISSNQPLSHVQLKVISNGACYFAFPLVLQESNICTSGFGGVSTCGGDSGGPLVVVREDKPILIGITSFGSAFGCQMNLPAVFSRVTTFLEFINQHL